MLSDRIIFLEYYPYNFTSYGLLCCSCLYGRRLIKGSGIGQTIVTGFDKTCLIPSTKKKILTIISSACLVSLELQKQCCFKKIGKALASYSRSCPSCSSQHMKRIYYKKTWSKLPLPIKAATHNVYLLCILR